MLSLEILEEHWPLEKLGNPVQVETRDLVDIKPQPTTISSNGFYGNKPQPQRPAQALPSRPNGTAHANIYPIEALSPYAHKWTIKARCTHKSDIKTWHKQSGEGKLFSVNFLDESGEIRATGFNAECDMLYDIFQEGEVYYISSPCRVQLAKKQFTNLSNDYELTFERDTQVEKVCCLFPTYQRVITKFCRPRIQPTSPSTSSPLQALEIYNQLIRTQPSIQSGCSKKLTR